ncbi:MAG: FAD-dependent monooxygenase [Chloroflexi bacterium]|nr:FAD-dependent monooxygenase [Chloroflexota bacterium]MDA1219906.1 FAD-dependent monooxygenase [Chloroflexota bacterium]PKB57855.1 MAG: salicylate 1-monooxygenase [SAR202 cluster bacterium Casp-Chloro-G3]
MVQHKLSVAIVGAGMGGLAAAATLQQIGVDVQVYEQARQFGRVGAGIQMMPNSMKVLQGIGVESKLRQIAFAPKSHLNRVGDTGEVTNELAMPEDRYGAPYLCMHRAALHAALAEAIPPDRLHLGHKLVGLEQHHDHVELAFDNGVKVQADAVVGADGVHSAVRDIILGSEQRPYNRGRVAYRAVFPAALLGGRDLGNSRTKWWGNDRHVVIYYTTAAHDEVYFVTSVPEPLEWMTPESWSTTGDMAVLRQAYSDFHEDVRAVLDACPSCHKWAILEREPLAKWSDGRVVLLGDACHPMTPYMAQGAATSIEDAAILARCLAEVNCGDVAGAFQQYEAHRKPRTSRIQAISSANTWMQTTESDTDWLYGYDAWTVPLSETVSI